MQHSGTMNGDNKIMLANGDFLNVRIELTIGGLKNFTEFGKVDSDSIQYQSIDLSIKRNQKQVKAIGKYKW